MDVDFAQLIQMCRFDCANTMYKFCGQTNHRKFGVPTGGYMSPGLAIRCCAMVELEMELGPVGLIVGSSAEEQLVMEHYGRIAVGYAPPLVLNVEQSANLHRFLELQLNTGGEALRCQLLNPVYSAAKAE